MKYLQITILLLFSINISSAQDYQTKDELKNQIIGSWHLENSIQDKIIFFEDGTIKRFYENELQSSGNYEITKKCEGETLSNKSYFLKEISENGSSFCAYIDSINYVNNGFFTLMTKNRGKIVIYKRVLEK